jgi:hypothetical protein
LGTDPGLFPCKMGHQWNIIYIDAQLCRVFVCPVFTNHTVMADSRSDRFSADWQI